MDDSLLLEERMSPGGGLLLMSCILVAPLVIAGYVGLTVLLFLPLLGLRWIFPRLRVAGVATFWNAATRSA